MYHYILILSLVYFCGQHVKAKYFNIIDFFMKLRIKYTCLVINYIAISQ